MNGRFVYFDIPPLEPLQFTSPKPGAQSKAIDQFSRTRDGEQSGNLILCQRSSSSSCVTGLIQPFDVFKGIRIEPLSIDRPCAKRLNSRGDVVQGARSCAGILSILQVFGKGDPANIGQAVPTTSFAYRVQIHFNIANVLGVPSQRLEFVDVVLDVLGIGAAAFR